MRSLIALALAVVALAAVPAAASASSFKAPHGKILWGGQGGYSRGDISDFARQSGIAPRASTTTSSPGTGPTRRSTGCRSGSPTRRRVRLGRDALAVARGASRLTPGDIARGEGDAFLFALNRLIFESARRHVSPPAVRDEQRQQPVLGVRPLGPPARARPTRPRSSSGPGAGIALIMRGGAVAVDRRAGCGGSTCPASAPALDDAPARAGRAHVGAALVRQPRDPEEPPALLVAGVCATSTGSGPPGTRCTRRARRWTAIYNYPLWRVQAVRVRRVGHLGPRRPRLRAASSSSFLRFHRRVQMAVYYQSASLKPEFRLSTHPLARAALRRALKWRRMTGVAPIL